ncbi:MAG: ABC transporter ATP-binding protein [Rhodospirillales bacterium]|jgi:oligopeptide transport system ATP-binding protein|nr:ABC transporter ATP-binding protein [Rhodospirillales bacterium]
MTQTPLLKVNDLVKRFSIRSGSLFGTPKVVHAVEGVSFHLDEGETLGLVGESGSGKSTVGRLLLRLISQTSGTVDFRGENIFELTLADFKKYRREMQMIFQDSMSSLNPRYTVGEIVGEPFRVYDDTLGKAERLDKVRELLEQVGLDGSYVTRFPHEFSGGQRQRIGIARAIAVNPKLIIADEPVSALDVSVQSQVLNLLQDLKERYGLSYLFIAHDLAVVKHMSQRVAVMYLGKIVETAPSSEIYDKPAHPYTQMLIKAVPKAKVDFAARKEDRNAVMGDIPSPINPPPGCAFHKRCKHKMAICEQEYPEYRELNPGHVAACHLL